LRTFKEYLNEGKSHVTRVGDYTIETWYDRHCRSYVTQLKDIALDQVGDALYDGTRDGSHFSHQHMIKEAGRLSSQDQPK
jgi:hypothetical protein